MPSVLSCVDYLCYGSSLYISAVQLSSWILKLLSTTHWLISKLKLYMYIASHVALYTLFDRTLWTWPFILQAIISRLGQQFPLCVSKFLYFHSNFAEMCSQRSDNGSPPIRRQAIICTNDSLFYQSIYAPPRLFIRITHMVRTMLCFVVM